MQRVYEFQIAHFKEKISKTDVEIVRKNKRITCQAVIGQQSFNTTTVHCQNQWYNNKRDWIFFKAYICEQK